MLSSGLLLAGLLPLLAAEECGLARHGPDRIVGGQEARPHEFPWQVYLPVTRPGGHIFFCGGSIVSRRHVLTAAHCLETRAPGRPVWVHVGRHLRRSGGSRHCVAQVTLHPERDKQKGSNDLAVLRLTKALQFSAHVAAVCLPVPGSSPPAGTAVLASGWGWTSGQRSSPAPRLQYVWLGVMDWTECRARLLQVGGSTGRPPPRTRMSGTRCCRRAASAPSAEGRTPAMVTHRRQLHL
jgi:hypothetical protein